MKAQSTIIAMVLILIVFVSVMIFLLSMMISQQYVAQTKSLEMKRFASNLLTSLLRMDTDCGKVSDMIKGAFDSTYCVGLGGCDCENFVRTRIDPYVKRLLNETGYTNLRYTITIEPESLYTRKIDIGDTISEKELRRAWSARTRLNLYNTNLNVRIYMVESKY